MARRNPRKILRVFLWSLSGLFLGGAAAFAGVAFIGAPEGAAPRFAPLGELWFQFDRGSLNLMQAVTERYLAVFVWDGIVFPILQQPAVMTFGVLGAIFGLIAWRLGWRRGIFSRRRTRNGT